MWDLAPVASEIEAQTIRWLAELVGFDKTCGGLMVSGGNVANLIGFWAARRAPDAVPRAGSRFARRHREAYVPTPQQEPKAHPWLSGAHEDPGRA